MKLLGGEGWVGGVGGLGDDRAHYETKSISI